MNSITFKCIITLILSIAVLLISWGSHNGILEQQSTTYVAGEGVASGNNSMGLDFESDTVQGKCTQGVIKLSNISFLSSVIDDKKEENISSSNLYHAFESITDDDLIYIENGDGYEETCAIPALDGTRILLVENGRNNLPQVIGETEKSFLGKKLKYHVKFDSVYDGGYRIDNYGFATQEELVNFRNESMAKICEMFSCEIRYENTEFGDLVCSPEVYLTKTELYEICNSGIGFLFISLT